MKSKYPNVSVPIDGEIDKALREEQARTYLKRADVVRNILRKHFGLPGPERDVAEFKLPDSK